MATAETREARNDVDGVILNIQVHPQIRRRLRIAAAETGLDMYEWLHRLLCGEFNCLELLHQVPRRPER